MSSAFFTKDRTSTRVPLGTAPRPLRIAWAMPTSARAFFTSASSSRRLFKYSSGSPRSLARPSQVERRYARTTSSTSARVRPLPAMASARRSHARGLIRASS